MDGLIDHVMIRVEDLDASVDWYTGHLGHEVKRRSEHETYTLVFLGPPGADEDEAAIELTYNHDGSRYELGDAWGHVALRVRDVYDAYEELVASGVEDYRDPDSCGGSYAFVRDPDGHEVELVERDTGARFGIDHVMMRVEAADRAIGWYARKLGYVPSGRWEAETFANYFLRPNGSPPEAASVELTYNYDGRRYDLGDAWGHIAVQAKDLHAYWETLMEREAPNYRDPESCGNRYAFTKDADGHEIEVLARG